MFLKESSKSAADPSGSFLKVIDLTVISLSSLLESDSRENSQIT